MKNYFNNLYTESYHSYLSNLNKYLSKNIKKFVLTANPEMFYIAQNNKILNDSLLNKNNDVVVDGIAVLKMAKKYDITVKEKISGVELSKDLIELAYKKKKTIYLFGSKKEVLDKLLKKLNDSYPGIKIVGHSDGYVKDKEKVIKEIVKLQPDVCLVALGIPMQEECIYKCMNKVKKGIYVGVGGTFDVLSGTKKRAPKLFIKTNTEWLYRILSEPKRIKRFMKYNVRFVIDILKDKKTND